jgi:type IV secretion system protein TrbL
MTNLNVIDQFLSVFIRYIDGGFGLVAGDVHHLATILIALDVTLAGLFWSLGGEDDIIARLVRKTLFVGAFAFIINQFSSLSQIIYESFAKLGLTAGGSTLNADDLLKPGHLAGIGFQAAWPLLDQASKMMGFTSFFDNFVEIAVLVIAWLGVVCAFFILAVQLFITILEFKLASLGGFILIPFALWNRTGFLAERVLGHVVASGIKVMMLGVIVGIGTGFFAQFVSALQGQEPDIGEAMTLVLASLTLLGLGIFGPSVASGLVSGGPQLGAGAAIGTAAMAGAGLGAAAVGARALASGGLAAIRSASAMPLTPAMASAGGPPPLSGASGGGLAQGVTSASMSGAGHTSSSSKDAGAGTGGSTGGDTDARDNSPSTPAGSNGTGQAPEWAQRLQRQQASRHRQQMLVQTLREGESRGGGSNPDLGEER